MLERGGRIPEAARHRRPGGSDTSKNDRPLGPLRAREHQGAGSVVCWTTTGLQTSLRGGAGGGAAKRPYSLRFVLRRELWRRGLRYRLHVSATWATGHRVPEASPGSVLRRRLLQLRTVPSRAGFRSWPRGTTVAYWVAKIQRNVVRDCEIDFAAGWAIVRVRKLRAPGKRHGIAELLVSRALTGTRLRHGVPRWRAGAAADEASRGSLDTGRKSRIGSTW